MIKYALVAGMLMSSTAQAQSVVPPPAPLAGGEAAPVVPAPAPAVPGTASSDGEITAVIAPALPPVGHPDKILVERDTLIRLMVLNEVSTKVAKAGDRFPLRVDEAVVVNGVTIIPVGATAWGEVLSAESSGVVGKSGKLGAKLLYVEVNGERVLLNGETRTAGAGGTAETVMGVVGIGILGLLARGNNAKLKAGEIFNGYLDSDMLFDPGSPKLVPVPEENEPVVLPVMVPAAQ